MSRVAVVGPVIGWSVATRPTVSGLVTEAGRQIATAGQVAEQSVALFASAGCLATALALVVRDRRATLRSLRCLDMPEELISAVHRHKLQPGDELVSELLRWCREVIRSGSVRRPPARIPATVSAAQPGRHVLVCVSHDAQRMWVRRATRISWPLRRLFSWQLSHAPVRRRQRLIRHQAGGSAPARQDQPVAETSVRVGDTQQRTGKRVDVRPYTIDHSSVTWSHS
jgi:hypothetical protein